MTPSEIFDNPEKHSISFDWKTPIDDMVFIMGNEWKEWGGIFKHKDIQSLVENYLSEEPIDCMEALGQEISVHGVLLYQISTDSDEKNLTIIEADSKDIFEQEAKSRKIKVWLQKQPRKKLGSKAKRISLAGRLPYEASPIDRWAMIFFSFPFALQLDILPSNSENGVLNAKRSILDLSIFPPNKHVTGKLTVVSFSQDLSLWAAIFYESSENVSVKVGKDILNLSDWQEVVSPEIGIDCLSKLHWVNESLLILYEDHAWLVDSVKSDAPVCKKILTLKRDKIRSFPAKPRFVKTLNGEAYVYSEFQLYHLKNHQLKPILRFRQDSIPECIPTGNHRFTYVLEGVQYEVDILEGIVRSRSIPYQDNSSSIHKLTSEWAVITREGYTNRDMDVLQFWHLKTDTWKHLKLGAFGQYGIVDMGLNNEGVGILQSEEMLFEVKDFMAKLEGFETLTVGTWSKEWGEEKEPPLIMGFVNRIKTLFKN